MTSVEMESIEFRHHGDPFIPQSTRDRTTNNTSKEPSPSRDFHCHGDPVLEAVLDHDKGMSSSIENPDGENTRPSDDEGFVTFRYNDPLFEAFLEHDRVYRRNNIRNRYDENTY